MVAERPSGLFRGETVTTGHYGNKRVKGPETQVATPVRALLPSEMRLTSRYRKVRYQKGDLLILLHQTLVGVVLGARCKESVCGNGCARLRLLTGRKHIPLDRVHCEFRSWKQVLLPPMMSPNRPPRDSDLFEFGRNWTSPVSAFIVS